MANKKTTGLFVGAAVAGLILASGCGGKQTKSSSSGVKIAMGECHGINSCKGTGACGGEGHMCAGKNSCKGKGWLKMSKSDCLGKSGTWKPM